MALSNPWSKRKRGRKQEPKVQIKSRWAKEKAKVRKRRVRQERSGKSSPQNMVSGHKKSKKRFLFQTPLPRDVLTRTVFWNAKQDHLLLIEFRNFNKQLPLFPKLFHSSKGQEYLKIFWNWRIYLIRSSLYHTFNSWRPFILRWVKCKQRS